ncbi:Pol protein [Elysia marginata]|uniref:Pol protein n=1 Tax=Elysia marginata TaxID=1093978 RepID=A0AAV4EQJ4_9GAST|nr:Pol protein [Elysia marginata]
MTQYVSRFIRGYATITESLRMLTKKTQPWTWGKPQQDAFDQLKSALTNAGVMSYFDPSIVKTKQLIREKVWFPGIDKLVEEHLKGCVPCQSSVTGTANVNH